MKLPIALLLVSAAVAACATAPSMSPLDWNGFIAALPGETLQLDDYPSAKTKVVAVPDVGASIEAGNARFERWCSSHGVMRFPSLMEVDREEAITNLDLAFEAKLEMFHTLYDVSKGMPGPIHAKEGPFVGLEVLCARARRRPQS